MKYITTVFIVFSFIFSSFTKAQTIPQEELFLDIILIPSNPQPQTRTIAQVTTTGGNINRASISWFLNGEALDSGVGRRQVEFIAPPAGTSAILSVQASLDGISGSTSFTVIPGQVDILWESPNSYTPPFYKGKAIPSAMATLRVVAIPSSLAPRTISYQWERNDQVLQGVSGAGRNAITIKNTELVVTEDIKVSVDSSQFQGENRIQITPRSPSIVIYPKNEGFIDYTKGSNESFSLTRESSIIRIEPYFFSLSSQNLADNLRFTYSFNDEGYVPEGRVNEIEISNPDTGGVSRLQIEIESIREALQNASRRITLFFNNQ